MWDLLSLALKDFATGILREARLALETMWNTAEKDLDLGELTDENVQLFELKMVLKRVIEIKVSMLGKDVWLLSRTCKREEKQEKQE